jgi:Cytochrome bd terminal oxidase subunit I
MTAMTWWLLASEPGQLMPARSQMAFTLGFHIILVPIGVALPTIMLIANYKGLRHNDPVALTLAQRWSHAAAVTFAVGAVTGTVLSFEMGLLWPGLTGTYGDVFGLPFQIEAISFAFAVMVGIGAVVALRADDRRMYERVTGRGLALLIVASVALVVTLALLGRRSTKGVRAGAALAVGALVWTWGVSQFPYLLPFDLTIDAGAGAAVTMRWILVWFLVALVTAVPALILLYVLGQRGEIAEDGATPEAYTGPTGLVQ